MFWSQTISHFNVLYSELLKFLCAPQLSACSKQKVNKQFIKCFSDKLQNWLCKKEKKKKKKPTGFTNNDSWAIPQESHQE